MSNNAFVYKQFTGAFSDKCDIRDMDIQDMLSEKSCQEHDM